MIPNATLHLPTAHVIECYRIIIKADKIHLHVYISVSCHLSNKRSVSRITFFFIALKLNIQHSLRFKMKIKKELKSSVDTLLPCKEKWNLIQFWNMVKDLKLKPRANFYSNCQNVKRHENITNRPVWTNFKKLTIRSLSINSFCSQFVIQHGV